MSTPLDVSIGPLSERICRGARWENADDFPSNQAWADVLERILRNLDSHGQFERFLPILRGKLSQRDGALAEAHAAFYLSCSGFKIISWEPPGAFHSIGEFEIQWQLENSIFVEVKGPGWRGELSSDEREFRKMNEKYINAEVRSLNTIGKVINAIEKTKQQDKFTENRPNLLVLYASNLFITPNALSPRILVPKVSSVLETLPQLGGVLILDAVCRNSVVRYETMLIQNSTGDCMSKLPKGSRDALSRHSS
jgi:hypothetical protein